MSRSEEIFVAIAINVNERNVTGAYPRRFDRLEKGFFTPVCASKTG